MEQNSKTYSLNELLEALYFAWAVDDFDWIELVAGEYDPRCGAPEFDAKDLYGRQDTKNITVYKAQKMFGSNGCAFVGYRLFIHGADNDEIYELWKTVRSEKARKLYEKKGD